MTIEHCYFVNKDLAITQYEIELSVVYPNGHSLRQFCYYPIDGADASLDLDYPYLVGLPSSKFINFFKSYTAYPLPTKFVLSEHNEVDQEIEDLILGEVKSVFEEIKVARNPLIKDALFTQPIMAEWMAIQHHQMYLYNKHVPSLQVCYYFGSPSDLSLKNLIALDENDVVRSLSEAKTRVPKVLSISPFDTAELIKQGRQCLGWISEQYGAYLRENRTEKGAIALAHKPDFSEKPLRVFIACSSYTTVMQYSAGSLAKAFEALGCEVLFLQDDEVSFLSINTFLEAYANFKPHITVNINHLNNSMLNPFVFNFVWWQDIMADLANAHSIKKRPRDFHYAFSKAVMDKVKVKVDDVRYQEQCVSEEVFYPPEDSLQRRDVIVFVGSSYYQEFIGAQRHIAPSEFSAIISDYVELIHNGRCKGVTTFEGIIKHYSNVNYHALVRVWIYIARREIIYTLIDQAEVPVELYGYEWDLDPVTAPLYKGSIENGKPLADLYRSVKYGLSVQPFMIGHQRLGEVTFCGAIPIVLDTANDYEEINYWDEMVTFKSPKELIPKIAQVQSGEVVVQPPEKMKQKLSYIEFAKRMLSRVEDELSESA